MANFKTPWNMLDVYDPNSFEKISKLPHQTIPDQSMSIQEIFERYARGIPFEAGRVPIYNGEEDDLPDPWTLDLSEQAEMRSEVSQELENIKKKDAAYKASKNKKTSGTDESTNIS